MGGVLEIEKQQIPLTEKEEKRERILRAAVDIFTGKLFHQVKMDEIAVQAGVGKGTLYLYFENKEHLFRETLKFAMELYYSYLVESLEEDLAPREKLKKFAYLHLDRLKEHLKVIFLLAGESMAPHFILQEEMLKIRRKTVTLLQGIIEEGVRRGEFRRLDTSLAARVYLGGIVTLMHDQFFENEENVDGEDITGEFAGLFFQGFNAHEEKRGQRGIES